MRKLIYFLVIFFWASSAFSAATWDGSTITKIDGSTITKWDGATVAASCTSVVADYWQPFDATDFLTSPPTGWVITDTGSNLSMSTSGEFATLKCPNGTVDTGTRGLAFNNSGGAAAYGTYTFTASDSVSVGFWFKPGSLINTWAWHNIFSFLDSGDSELCMIQAGDGGSNMMLRLYCGTGSSTISISTATQYWISAQFSKAGTSSLAVYDSTGSQVGSTVTDTAPNYQATKLYIGFHAAYGTGTSYFDDLLIDFTDATFPLGP